MSVYKAYKRWKKKGPTYRGKGKSRGSGHQAGEGWGELKHIDPTSSVRKYSKNSPSFDEGVWRYKSKQKALNEARK